MFRFCYRIGCNGARLSSLELLHNAHRIFHRRISKSCKFIFCTLLYWRGVLDTRLYVYLLHMPITMFDCSIFREHERYFAIAMPDSMTRCPLTRTSQLLDSTHCWATCAEKKGADSLTLTTIFMTTTRGMCTIFFTADLPKCTAIFDPFSFCTVLYWMQRQISCSGATTSHKTAASRVGDGDWLCFLGVF